jgi:gliding motility-associated-like protein
LLIAKLADATHIVGGEIYYDNLGGNNYKIHMKVYRDCINGVPPFDNPAFFTIFNASGGVVTTLNVAMTSSITVPPSNNSPCAPSANGVACVEEAIYETTINLPPLAGGYYIVYQRCCRNGTILNLINPGNVGATYWEHIPGPEVVAINSSPRFNFRPPIYICANNPIAFNHSATDPDGDSLVYSLCTPFDGLNTSCPVIDPTNISCPTANTPPPYVSVPFVAPYSSSYPLASSPAININPVTGFLNGNPTILGQWVVGVCVSEYRNGVLIGTHHRDFQFNVISCPYVINAVINSQVTSNNGQGTGYCNGYTVNFSNSSTTGAIYHWDFGDLNTIADTSNLYNPSYTYTAAGDYTVSIIVKSPIAGNVCADTMYSTFHIHPLLSPSFLLPADQCFIGNHFNFTASGSYQGNGTISWNFGSTAIPQTANTASVSNVSYSAPGINTVSLTIAENGCTATVTHTVEVAQNPVATIGSYPTSGCAPLTFTIQNQSTTGPYITYLWTFSDGTTSNNISPTITFTNPGVYSFTLSAMSNQVCIDTTNMASVSSITVIPTPTAQFNVTPAYIQCFNGHVFNFNNTSTTLGSATYTWSFGANASTVLSNALNVSNVTYTTAGIYPVTLSVKENGCLNAYTHNVELYNNPVAALGSYSVIGCDPMSVTFANSSTSASPLTYLWSFSDGTTSSQANPTHVFTPPGVYSLSLTVSTNSLCIGTSSIQSVNSITVNPSPVAGFTATPMVTTIFDPDITFSDSSSVDVVSWNYDFADGTGSSIENPFHTYTHYGNYQVIQTVNNSYGCPNSTTLLIKILPEFRFWIPNCYTPGNHDGLNDVFKPIVIGVEEYTFYIYNRWGELIYKTDDTEQGWDGSFKGKPSPNDVYVWKIDFKNIVSREHESHIGHVTLLN